MAADLSDEVILEIITRLPLKYAIQCLLLNKKFFRWISDPSFLRQKALLSSSSSLSSIFCCSGNTLTRITPQSSSGDIFQVSKILSLKPIILASCSGVLLLRFLYQKSSYFVFNPTTGAIMFIDCLQNDNVGLAIDLNSRNFCFKLVTIEKTDEPTTVRFSVIVPSSDGSSNWLVKSQVEFASRNSIHPCSQSVYVHGCLHWLTEEGKRMIVFDVENEKARVMNGPVKNNEPGFRSILDKWLNLSVLADSSIRFHSMLDMWFGFADGLLQFVYNLREEVIIKSHDYIKDAWQVKHKIGKELIGNVFISGVSLFFDGQRLFVNVQKREDDDVVLMYDIPSDKWTKTATIRGRRDFNELFFSYFPTLAKVSDKYLHNDKTEMQRSVGLKYDDRKVKNSFESFEGLQRLLTGNLGL